MISDAVKIARSNERIKIMETTRDVLTNPLVDVLIAYLIIEYYQGHDVRYADGSKVHVGNGGWVSEATGDAMEVALGAYLLAPSFAKISGEVTEGIIPLIKAIAPALAQNSTALLATGV